MTWTAPSKASPTCILPKFLSKEAVTPIISVDVDDTFITAWESEIIDTHDPKELHDKMLCLTHTFSSLIRKGQYSVKSEEKSAPDDLVTEMDQGIETLCRMWLNRHYPDHKIIGEEGPKAHIETEDVVWYLDPVDGTSNFVDKDDNVAVHIGCVYQGKPWVGIVSLPFKDESYSYYHGQNKEQTPFTPPKTLVAGAEFRESTNEDTRALLMLNQRYGARHHQVKSIGVNIIDLLKGKESLFFKGNVKFWDIIAPLIILDSHQKGLWNIAIFIPNTPTPKAPSDYDRYSPFGNEKALVERINTKSLKNSRIGHIIVTPKGSRYEVEILQEILVLR